VVLGFAGLALHAGGAAIHYVIGLFRGDQVPVITDGVAQGGVSSSKVDAFLLWLAARLLDKRFVN
jgi:hypothetical protein